jgi:hypothetical protein
LVADIDAATVHWTWPGVGLSLTAHTLPSKIGLAAEDNNRFEKRQKMIRVQVRS